MLTGRRQLAALVTGAAQGIGLAIAERLAAAGYAVALVDTSSTVLRVGRSLADQGHDTFAAVTDVADEQAVGKVVQDVSAHFGGLDVLVNNAGISPKPGGRKSLVQDMTSAEWDRVMAVNLRGVFLMCRACIVPLTESDQARIVNITSLAARSGTAIAGAHYAASKSAVAGFSRILAAEVAELGITVNCVAPGRIRTPLAEAQGEAVNQAAVANIPLRRLGQGADVAAAVAYLVSRDAAFMTGATIDVNGGQFMP